MTGPGAEPLPVPAPFLAAARASGKVILLGEHAVVYGAPALVAGIDRGAAATATLAAPGVASQLLVRAGEASAGEVTGEDADVRRAFAAALASGDPLPPVLVDVATDLPPGGGLGCSAALGVAVVRAALRAAGRSDGYDEVIARATAWERVFHGNPSGIDAAAAALGGCFEFRRAEAASHAPGSGGLTSSVRSLQVPRAIVLVVVSSGVASSTRAMVEGLADRRRQRPAEVDRRINGIAAVVDQGRRAIEGGDLRGLGECMDENQSLLRELELSSGVLETMTAAARAAGALGAKLTGKGGGGAVIALCKGRPEAEAVMARMAELGKRGFITEVSPRTEARGS